MFFPNNKAIEIVVFGTHANSLTLYTLEMSEGEGHGNIGKESLSIEIKAMMSNMFTEFKTDIMQSVADTMETRFNELYEEYDYSDVEESHNNLDVSALMQTITDSNKGESSTPQVTKTGNQPTEFEA